MLTVAAMVVALLLAAVPAWAQGADTPDPKELTEATGVEAREGSPRVGDGSVKTSDGGRSIRVGDGCVLIEDEGGEELAVGSCDEGEDAEGRSGGDDLKEPRRDKERTARQNTTEQTVIEETIPEGTAPAERTGFEEPTASEGPVREEAGPEEDSGADAECPTMPEGETFEATVERAVDGDTLELDEPVDGVSRVRLIGVDAPETEGQDGEPEPYAEETGDFTASELEGERVLLELDRETTDPYGRLLAYAWRERAPSPQENPPFGGDEPELFNLTLLEGGYATTMHVEPNTRYAGCFDPAERAAREEGDGLWGVGVGSEDERYGEETGPESVPPEATGPERALPEETNAGGPVEREEFSGPASTSGTAGRPERTLPEAAEPTERTVPDLPEETSEETAEVPYGRYEESEESIVAEVTVPETASTSSAPEGGHGIEVETGPVAQPTADPTATSRPALPTRQTPEGQVPVLPETGGATSLPLFLGTSCIAAGVLSLALLRRGERRRGACSDER
jgi:micrococcal nuclease